jgi:hypothetical protein
MVLPQMQKILRRKGVQEGSTPEASGETPLNLQEAPANPAQEKIDITWRTMEQARPGQPIRCEEYEIQRSSL